MNISNNSNYVVNLESVTFSYRDKAPIINNITLKIPRKKVIAIMGGSGSGKTTLLKLISGQIKPLSGSIKVFDEDIVNQSNKGLLELRKKLGLLFQFGALFTDMNVYDNVAFNLRENTNLPESIIRKVVAMKLNAVGLFGTQNLMPNDLSGGMARRVALARATVLDPELMLYDEPFTGLDPISLNVIARLIKELNEFLNQTSILVTHDINSSFKIADYIYFLGNGKIVAEGSPQEIKNSENEFVKKFILGGIDDSYKYEYQSISEYHSYLSRTK